MGSNVMKTSIVAAALALGLTALIVSPAWSDDQREVREALKQGRILPLTEILASAAAIQPGRVIEVELEQEDGRYVYELEILDEHGVVWELYVNAENGELIKRERED